FRACAAPHWAVRVASARAAATQTNHCLCKRSIRLLLFRCENMSPAARRPLPFPRAVTQAFPARTVAASDRNLLIPVAHPVPAREPAGARTALRRHCVCSLSDEETCSFAHLSARCKKEEVMGELNLRLTEEEWTELLRLL